MSSIFENLHTERQFKSSTGLSRVKFEELAETFAVYYRPKEAATPYSKPPVLTDPKEALFFILYYFKTGLTYQVLGLNFGISDYAAHSYKKYIIPFLKQALAEKQALAHHIFEDQADFDRAFEDIDDILVDGYEIPIERSSDKEEQKDCYSGKKKRHTLIGLVISDLSGRIIYMSDLYPGSQVDMSIFKWELPDYNYEKLRVWLDSGFQGIKKILKNTSINIPIKKRKNKKRTESEKEYNQKVARIRIRVEHSIGGMKKYAILQNRYRLKESGSLFEITALCTGLYNFSKSFVNF